jgi:hypothetical protein
MTEFLGHDRILVGGSKLTATEGVSWDQLTLGGDLRMADRTGLAQPLSRNHPPYLPQGKAELKLPGVGDYDDIPRILAQLTRSVGAENFAYLIPLEMPRPIVDEDEG